MSEKFNGKPMTPENQRDEDLKKVKENLYRKLTELRLDNPKFGEPLEELVDAALTAQRQSWEREKKEIIAELLDWKKVHGDTLVMYSVVRKEKEALEAEKKGLETQLSAWFSTFGTNQLSHAIDRLESAEKEKARLEEKVKDLSVQFFSENLKLEERVKEQEYFISSLHNYDGDAKRLLEETVLENRRLKSRNEELEKKLEYFQSQFNHYHTLAEKVTLENERLKAENERLRKYEPVEPYIVVEGKKIPYSPSEVDRLKIDRDRLTAALGAANHSLAWIKKLLPKNQAELDNTVKNRLYELSHYLLVDFPEAIEYCLSDPSGSVAFEKWKKLEAVVVAAKWAKEHLEINLWKSLGASPDEDIDDEDRPQGLIKLREALEALDAKGSS